MKTTPKRQAANESEGCFVHNHTAVVSAWAATKPATAAGQISVCVGPAPAYRTFLGRLVRVVARRWTIATVEGQTVALPVGVTTFPVLKVGVRYRVPGVSCEQIAAEEKNVNAMLAAGGAE